MSVKVKCHKCGKSAKLGVNATQRKGKPICDTCAGVVRERHDGMNIAWFPGEQTMTLVDPDTWEVTEIRQRPQP
jgi:hypothetical protein